LAESYSAKIEKIFELVETGGKLSSTNDQDVPNSPDIREPEQGLSLRTFFKAGRRVLFVVSAITLVAIVVTGFVLFEFAHVTSQEPIFGNTPGDTYSTRGANLAFLVLVVCVTAYGIAQHRKKKSKAKSS